MIRALVSWPAIAVLTLVYWAALFARMRAHGRRDFDRAFQKAAAENPAGEPFDVSLAVEWNPIRSMAVVLGVPALLILIRALSR